MLSRMLFYKKNKIRRMIFAAAGCLTGTILRVSRRNERSPSYSIRVAQHGTSIDDSDPDPSLEATHSQSESR